jgi:protoheme IX farnesyltransferase
LEFNKNYTITYPPTIGEFFGTIGAKISDYLMLSKLGLSLSVVISSILGFLIVSNGRVEMFHLLILFTGGLLVTIAANTINQVLEKDFDKLMSRTSNRPIAKMRLSPSQGVFFAGVSMLVGSSLLAFFNPLTALLGVFSTAIYAFVYTPLKRFTSLAVPLGAIPGAMPVLIGVTAVEGRITVLAIFLFIIQFLWQFPHFWAIGFLGFDDYKKAGFRFVPSNGGEVSKRIGVESIVYTFSILPIIGFMYINGFSSIFSMVFAVLLTAFYLALSIKFYWSFDKISARKLMFYSFIYLPLILVNYWLF